MNRRPVHRMPAAETPYMIMSVQAVEAPKIDNLLAALCSWTTLAGFIILPGTFTSLETSEKLGNSTSGKLIQHAVKNTPLLAVGIICWLSGMIGSCFLWYRWRRNYIWLMMHIFL
jgi:hypothetical protein